MSFVPPEILLCLFVYIFYYSREPVLYFIPTFTLKVLLFNDSLKTLTEDWFVGTAFESDAAGCGFYEEVPDEFGGGVGLALARSGEWRSRNFQGEAEIPRERVGISHDKCSWSSVFQHYNGCKICK